MKPCNNCNLLKPDDQYAIDRTREDGLALICRDCNKAKCKQWYRDNQAKKKALALAYKAEHGHSPHLPKAEKIHRVQARQQEQKADEPDDWQMIRFAQSEWLHCLQSAQELGLDAQQYVRTLVRDDRDRRYRRAFLADVEESA